MEQILIVEDEKRIRDIVRDYFTAHGLGCDLARDGAEALDLLRDHDYDAILLDIFMPNLDGFQVCRAVRKRSQVPILFLTALGNEEDVLRGYALGGDDYVTKPFSLAVLLARTRALIRRSRGGDGAGLLTCGAVTLDGNRRTCTVNGREARLSPREYDLLECLLRNKGQALSRAQLLDKVWGLDFQGDDRAVDVRIRSLRSALGEAGGQIKTVFKVGYRMEEGGGMVWKTRPRRLRWRMAVPMVLALVLIWWGTMSLLADATRKVIQQRVDDQFDYVREQLEFQWQNYSE